MGCKYKKEEKKEWVTVWRIAQVAHVKRATVSNSLRSLMINERMWVNRSGRSLKMSALAQVAHHKWANEQIACFFFASRSFTHYLLIFCKKLAIRSENGWANSQPCTTAARLDRLVGYDMAVGLPPPVEEGWIQKGRQRSSLLDWWCTWMPH